MLSVAFAGFPRKVRFTPVPSPLFGPLLEQIDDLAELKCTLRVIWLLHEKRGFPRYVTLADLLGDRVLAKGLRGDGDSPRGAIARGLGLAVERGTLLASESGGKERIYMLNTEADRKALGDMAGRPAKEARAPRSQPAPEYPVERPNIFSLYEDNIGMLSPMIAEDLKEAEEAYPEKWIEDAFREAVANNKRSWRYIETILERWAREGRSDGGPVGHPKKGGYKDYFRR